MNISEASKLSGVPAKTIRYYESIGLISPPARSDNNYRSYQAKEVETLRFIQRARSLGFSVKDVAALLALYRDPKRRAASVRTIVHHHVGAIDRKIAELEGLKRVLEKLVHSCHGKDRPDCPILEEMAAPQKLAS